MFKKTLRRLDLNTTLGEAPSIRALQMRNLLNEIRQSPYKESFKEYWATPVPWQPREYGAKPKLGEPIPCRDATVTLLCAYNRHADKAAVARGEDNDYKVLMMFREPKGRFLKDQFVLPSAPVNLADRDDDWVKLLARLGVKTAHKDIHHRLAAIRALLVEANLLVIPPHHGQIAEVQGPPGPKKWHMMISQFPQFMRTMLDIFELPFEESLTSLKPFCRVQTPVTEQQRFDAKSYVVTMDKIPCVKYSISTIGEQLFWVSPKEALARFDAGVMDMPTPNCILMSQLDKMCPSFAQLKEISMTNEPDVIRPELVHNPESNMASVLLPGDIHYKRTIAERELKALRIEEPEFKKACEVEPEKDAPLGRFNRFEFVKDEPWGVRPVFTDRPIEDGDDTTPLVAVASRVLQQEKLDAIEEDKRLEELRKIQEEEEANEEEYVMLRKQHAQKLEHSKQALTGLLSDVAPGSQQK